MKEAKNKPVSSSEPNDARQQELPIFNKAQPQEASPSQPSDREPLSPITEAFLKNTTPYESALKLNDSIFGAATDFYECGYKEMEALDKILGVESVCSFDSHYDLAVKAVGAAYSKAKQKHLMLVALDGANHPSPAKPKEEDKVREFLLSSTLFINLENANDHRFVDLKIGLVRTFDLQNVRSKLGNDYSVFTKQNVIHAMFEYNPFKPPVFKDDLGAPVYNTFTPPNWYKKHFYQGLIVPSVTKLPEVFSDFLNHFTNGDVDSFEYVLDWLATALTGRNHTYLIAIAAQGTGKTLFGDVQEKLFGESNFVRTKDEVLKGRFNGLLKNKKLVYIDEVNLTTLDHMNNLKDLVNKRLPIEQKNKDASPEANHANFYMSSNYKTAFKIEANERRLSIINATDTPLKEKSVYNQIELLLCDDTIEQLGYYLLGRRVTRDMNIPFHSTRFNEVLEAGIGEWQEYFVNDWCPKHKGTRLSLNEVKAHIQKEFDLKSAPGRKKFETLQEHYPKVFKVRKIDCDRYIEIL